MSPGETVLSPNVWGAALIQWHSRGCFLGKDTIHALTVLLGGKWRRPHKGLFHRALRGAEGSCSFHTLPGLGVRGESGLGLGLEAEGPWTLQALPSLPLPACSQVLALPSFPPPPSPLLPQPEASLSWAGGGRTRASGLGEAREGAAAEHRLPGHTLLSALQLGEAQMGAHRTMWAVELTFGVPGVGELILPHANGPQHLQPVGRVSRGGPIGGRGTAGEGGRRLGWWWWRKQGPCHVAVAHGSGSRAGHLPHARQCGHGQGLRAGIQGLGGHVDHHAAQWLRGWLWERVVAWHQRELGPHVGRQ